MDNSGLKIAAIVGWFLALIFIVCTWSLLEIVNAQRAAISDARDSVEHSTKTVQDAEHTIDYLRMTLRRCE